MAPVSGHMPCRDFTRALHVAIQDGWPPRIIAREPVSGSGSRDLHAGQGVRPHGRCRACGLMFVMVGSETTTSPRVVMPNRYCWPLVASNATRSGPMIGSRMEIFFCWLKKNVSNTRMLVSGDAVKDRKSVV